MKSETVLRRAVEVVGFVMGLFGGFLTNSAPPEDVGAGFSIGAASAAMLLVLLLTTGLVQHLGEGSQRGKWILASVLALVSFLVSVPTYRNTRSELTYQPSDPHAWTVTRGTDLTPRAKELAAQGLPFSEIFHDLGGQSKPSNVWEADSIRRSGNTLLKQYLWLVLSLSTCLFCLAEGVLPRPADMPPKPVPESM